MQTIYLSKGERVLTRVVAFLSALPKDKDYELTIKEKKRTRTIDQNAKLWAIYSEILKQGGEDLAGWTKDELHEFFLIEHFGSEVKSLWGKKKLRPLHRSSKLNKQEFSDLLETIFRFMAERGVYIE